MKLQIPQPKTLLVLALGMAALYGFVRILPSLQIGMDWEQVYRPAALAMAHGKSPYSVVFYAAPWSVIPLIPFALLPPDLGNAGVFILGLSAFAYVALKLGAGPGRMCIFLLSAPVVGCLIFGNIEWMALLGLVLPAPIGLIFAIVKPQVGIGVVIYWFVHAFRTGGIRSVIRTFTPVTLVTLLSFWLYGFWPLIFRQTMVQSRNSPLDYNTSLWPQGIFVGLWLLYKGIQRQKPGMAIASSPFLSPYALQFTWVSVLAGVIGSPLELILVSIGLWIPAIIRTIAYYS